MKAGHLVFLPAVLYGMGQTVQCDVLARRHTTISNRQKPQFEYVYSYWSVVGAPDGLPDGDYRVSFAGVTVEATRLEGNWSKSDHGPDELQQAYRIAS